tara:strand:- start:49270 stop:49566 length:297 start_codon:yes stop_codon:yes gene_type:complete
VPFHVFGGYSFSEFWLLPPTEIRQFSNKSKFDDHFREPAVDCSGQSSQETVQTVSSAACNKRSAYAARCGDQTSPSMDTDTLDLTTVRSLIPVDGNRL